MGIIITLTNKDSKKIFGSMRVKIFNILVITSILPIVLLSIGLLQSYKNDSVDAEITKMYRDANTLATNLDLTNYFELRDSNIYLMAIETIMEGRIVILNNNGVVTYDSTGLDIGYLYVSDEVIKGLKGTSQDVYYDDLYMGKVIVPIEDYSINQVTGLVIIYREFYEVRDTMSTLISITVLAVIGIAVLVVTTSFYTSMLITKPFGQVITHINNLIKGISHEKLQITGNYEAEKISDAFNEMIEEIWQAENSRQQFVANVSHELKTPLSSIKILAESLLSQENVPEELYREFLTDINSEVDRETQIINDLLTLVTLDKNENSLNIQVININDLVERILRRLKPLADKKGIQLLFESFRVVEAEVDSHKMESIIGNLIDNAIKYNRDDGMVTVTLDANHNDFKLIVQDTGYGIPSESLEKVFKRFYRVDKTRSRATGGTGLGLSIVKETINMHHGTITCESDEETYSKFIITIPLRYNS